MEIDHTPISEHIPQGIAVSHGSPETIKDIIAVFSKGLDVWALPFAICQGIDLVANATADLDLSDWLLTLVAIYCLFHWLVKLGE